MEIKQLLNLIKSEEKNIQLNSRLLDVYSGNLLGYVKQSLSEEISPESFKVAQHRLPSINLLEQIVKKLSKVYSDLPKRSCSEKLDDETVQFYLQNSNLNESLSKAETLLNLQKRCAIEPYVDNGVFQFRVLAAHEFMVLSDDDQNPNRVTHFVKFMGNQKKDNHTVNVYWVYTDSEFIIVDSDGDVLQNNLNPYNIIPFVYLNSDSFSLLPKPDVDSFNNAVLIPKLLGDLCHSAAFMSRSIIFGVDVDTTELKNSPDVMWNIRSVEGDNKKPQIGTIEPKVDIQNVLSLISSVTSGWLANKGIKPGSVGSLTVENVASGISKIVDEAETSAVVDKNRILLVKAEKQLWKLVSVIHNVLLPTGILTIQKGLSQNLNVSVMFPIQQPIKDPTEKRNELKFKLDNKLTSYTRALKEANLDLSEDEIMKLKLEIEQEQNIKQEPKPNLE